MAYRLLELYIQLKDLGNPQYCEGKVSNLSCGIDCTTADERVRETEAVVKDWKTRVQDLRCQYKWLLFFSIPKTLRLFKLLSQSNLVSDCSIQVDKILGEICFLFKNDQETRNALKHSIMVCFHPFYVYTQCGLPTVCNLLSPDCSYTDSSSEATSEELMHTSLLCMMTTHLLSIQVLVKENSPTDDQLAPLNHRMSRVI